MADTSVAEVSENNVKNEQNIIENNEIDKTKEALSFNPKVLQRQFLDEDYDSLSETFIHILMHFRNNTYQRIDKNMQYFINSFAKNFLYFFTQEEYIPNDVHMGKFIDLNPVISNIIYISSFRTTDSHLEILLSQKKNFAKLLAIYSPRNKTRINRKVLFDTEPNFATQWYFCFLENYKTGCVAENSLVHLREHITYAGANLIGINGFIHHAFFGCTYIDHERDYLLKDRINKLVRQWEPAKQIVDNKPKARAKRKKIGVFSSMWFRRQSVYRSQHPFIEKLAQSYDLTLIHLGPERKDLDDEVFKDVKNYQITKNPADFSAFSPNEFDVAYFPDIGMNIESIFLSNIRIAPVQICNYGHPVSTYGGLIDYWIGGQDGELADHAAENYTERLVLIPGVAAIPTYPTYELQSPAVQDDIIIINCPWTGQKINYDHLSCLKDVLEKVEKPVLFRFFPGGSVHGNGFIPLERDIKDIVGEKHVEVMRDLDYESYMFAMESGHFAIDSYPFGGFNSVIDSLYCGKPLISLEGSHFYNRACSYLLKEMGMGELAARSTEEYVDLIVKMTNDDNYRRRQMKKARVANVHKTIADQKKVESFVRAVDYLIENHETLKKDVSREPIYID